MLENNYIDATMTLTYGQTFNEINNREKIQRVSGKGLVRMLEKESKGQPLILIIAGTRQGNTQRGDKPYRMREARQILVYESWQYQEIEKKRQDREDRVVTIRLFDRSKEK